MTINDATTLGHMVADDPACAAVLERFGLDYCCGGKQTLSQACQRKGVSPDRVINELEGRKPFRRETDWTTASLHELVGYIEERYHERLRRDLPGLVARMAKVQTVHGARHPKLEPLGRTLSALVAELLPHMNKEEAVLFPWIRDLERSGRSEHPIEGPIRVMEHEHDQAGRLLEQMHQLTDGYRPPEGACATYRALYAGLQEVEQDTHRHIHLENAILFPRALRLAGRSVS